MILKSLKFGSVSFLRLTFIYDVYEIVGQNEGYSFTSESKFLLKMTQNVTEIDMKQLSSLFNHYIVRMSVGYPKNVRCYAVTCATQGKFFDRFVQRCFRVVVIL